MDSAQQAALFSELKERFETLKDQFRQLDSAADAQIVRWRYAEDAVFVLQADYFRRFNEKPGTLVDDEPTQAYIFHAYGYDDRDRIVYDAIFQTEEDPRACSFYTYGDDQIDMAHYYVELYTDHYHLNKVARLMGITRPAYYATYSQSEGREDFGLEAYHYDEQGRLARITHVLQVRPRPLSAVVEQRMKRMVEDQRRMARMLGTEAMFEASLPTLEQMIQGIQGKHVDQEYDDIYVYDGDTLKYILMGKTGEASPDAQNVDPRLILYEAPRDDETDDSLFEAARTALRTAIIEQFERMDATLRLRETVYNLQLSYDAVADDGVLITLGTDTQRDGWEEEADEYSYRAMVWHQHGAGDLGTSLYELPLEYERFMRNYRRDKRWGDIRSLLVQVARDLNAHDWTGLLNITDDFIVFANDYEALEDIHDEIRACVPKDKLKKLIQKGLLLD